MQFNQDIKVSQSDAQHFGVINDIKHIQKIKNCDLDALRELGSGTFGAVYHSKWRGADVAIKRIHDIYFAGKSWIQEQTRVDFWNEIFMIANLHHPNIITFYGIVWDGPRGSFAAITEYMVDGSLRSALINYSRFLDKRKCILIAIDVAFGMEYLHDQNIIHFDLKSDNLLVNLRDPNRPICKVGDFGLSKVKCSTSISSDSARGTIPWMAPELLNGRRDLVSEKVDVFSFGIVMWELLMGQEPYANIPDEVIIDGIVSNTLRPSVPESCDPEWRSLMEQCWSTEPSKRPCFTEIANKFHSFVSSACSASFPRAKTHGPLRIPCLEPRRTVPRRKSASPPSVNSRMTLLRPSFIDHCTNKLEQGLIKLIIKNCNLDELRELGSGTFGAVYYGKWRGADVAIKRIYDIYFAGKSWIQERTFLDKKKRLLIAIDVAFGMEYLNDQNIIHFDLKSDHLLINLRDPHRPICNIDVFSFDITMWELLMGQEPYIVSNTLRPLVLESCDYEWRSSMEKCWLTELSKRPCFIEIAKKMCSIVKLYCKFGGKLMPHLSDDALHYVGGRTCIMAFPYDITL
ncbi:hypothetical protein IEQ34_016657 [Dendrobium chrysotoxum]|uniref:Protein kinase domain-containing protein n=1 Tax=Dendrobium chrysotoxum TaxID=161865 RepID=A0AAV7GG89_DENCH|nr:hypothetical protein IEQ34_016657 [Dendrobium chrysotoxum]